MDYNKYKIAVIATWFGKLPSYFYMWLKSAEQNKMIDFLIFSDQEINSHSENIYYYKTTMKEELQRYSIKINRTISIDDAYKFCDCRLFFGLFYEDFLKKYDFWGYCDIDLAFGDIRKFITNEVLDIYDRIYQYGHLSLYRNNDKMKYIFELPGSIYSLDEVFEGKAKTTIEEYFGVNRICKINKIRCYTKIDYADLVPFYPKRLNLSIPRKNYMHQIFLWEDGRAYRLYYSEKQIKKEELVYIHWQKRKPQLDSSIKYFYNKNKIIITPEKFVSDWNEEFTIENMDKLNPPLSDKEKKRLKKKYHRSQIGVFLRAEMCTKKIWIRQIKYRLLEKYRWKSI
ncbi:MAG: hypothetical protein HFJ05_07190 [Eubacterium sp.]|nr:hypothetical protein [Eubacterium sp.]